MSAPQPPEDRDPQRPTGAAEDSTEGGRATYEFHGEKLDFDPYRFGAPEPAAPAWNPTAPGAPPAPGADPTRPAAPGERWNPGGTDSPPAVKPGDYWQGGGAQPRGGGVFPPAGYTPPATDERPDQRPDERGQGGIDLGKRDAPAPGGTATTPQYPPPTGAPAADDRSLPAGSSYTGGYPAPGANPYGGYPAPGGHPAPGGYPGAGPAAGPQRSNKLAVAGFIVAMAGCALFFTSIFAVLIGGAGLGLSIAGYVRARRGAPHKTFAVLGLVFSIVAIAAGVALLVYAISQYDLTCIANLDGDSSRLSECVK